MGLPINAGNTGIPLGPGPNGWSHWYGNWGGPGFASGGWQSEIGNFPNSRSNPDFHSPVNPLDECFYRHDVCLHNASRWENCSRNHQERRNCDKKLAECMARVRTSYTLPGVGGVGTVPKYGDTSQAEKKFNNPDSPNDTIGEYNPGDDYYPTLHFWD